MTWKEWGHWYADLFGLTSERDHAMIALWVRDLFVPDGFSADDLREAGLLIARGSDLPRFREQHLERLTAEATNIRAARVARDANVPSPGDWSSCRDCEGTGLVSVPQDDPGFLARAKGHHTTCLVVCSCAAGRAFATRTRPDWMSLAQYEERCPLWRDVLAGWREEQRAYQRARGHAQAVDQTLGKIVQRLAGK